jgi:maleylpyruvate isomerase
MESVRPADDLESVQAAHVRVLATVEQMTDAEAEAPSRLPGWTRGHVVTHLARNADSLTWVLEGARLGEVRDQYPTAGMREADIDAGAGRPASALIDDLAAACARLEATWLELDDDAWRGECRMRAGLCPAVELPFRRWREVEVHHVDLGLAYTATDWPPEYVAAELARLLPRLADRADPNALAAWLLDRGDAPDLTAW